MSKSKSSSAQRRALISVYDKTGIVEFAKELVNLGYSIISTGGTAKILVENNIPIIPIQEITGNPESFDSRMKSLSFQIGSGILFKRSNPKHVQEAKKLNIKPIDLVVCNLYPFEQTSAKKNVKFDEVIESIDVGGPTMIRAAAKNFKDVLVIVDPNDYQLIFEHFTRHSGKPKTHPESDSGVASLPGMTNKQLAAKAFNHLSFYDSQIARYLSSEIFPQEITIPLRKIRDLRYGENSHQQAALYVKPNSNSPMGRLEKLWGRDLSLINASDINAGLDSVRLFKTPAAVVIKHNNPCGIALGKDAEESLDRAINADPESAFGGIIVLNASMDLKTAHIIASFKNKRKGNIDIIACPQIKQNALDFLKSIRKSMGIYTFGKIPQESNDSYNIKWIDGGLIVQTPDADIEKSFSKWEVVTKKQPSAKQTSQMKIAWKFISRIKSNAILVVDKNLPMTRGIGSGQTSRIRSVKLALEQAGRFAQGAILASDSFFPFDDSVKLAVKQGITAIVQQGGSINDKASIKAADDAGITMIFTHRRAFWH